MAPVSPEDPIEQISTPATEGKRWSVGTLVYTSGGLVALFCWLLWGDFVWALKDRSALPVMQLLLKKYNASDFVLALLTGSIPAAIGLFLGPIISYKSDRHRGPRGRRIPYILLTTPITSLTMFGLAAAPWLSAELHHLLGKSSPGLSTCFLIVFGTCWTLFEFATVAANSVFGALVNDVVPQAVIGRFFGLFRAFSLIAAIIFNYSIIGHASEYYAWIFIGIGLLYGVGVTAMCFMVREGEYPPPPEATGEKQNFFAACQTYFKDCFGNPYYLWFFLGVTLAQLAMSPVNLFSVPYAKSIDMSMDQYGKWISAAYVGSLVLAYPLGALADRIHPLRLSMIAMGMYALVAVWGGIYAQDAGNFAIALFAHTLISGIFFTASASLPQRLLPRTRFAELLSAYGVVISLCSIGFPFALGAFLDYAHHAYRYTFYVGGGISMAALAALYVLYCKFLTLGGVKNYIAPE